MKWQTSYLILMFADDGTYFLYDPHLVVRENPQELFLLTTIQQQQGMYITVRVWEMYTASLECETGHGCIKTEISKSY